MKAMTLIPDKIQKKYQIRKHKDCISVYNPATISIYFDDQFEIKTCETTIDIRNDKCCVSLYRRVFMMIITIY